MYPDKELGKRFWDKIRNIAKEKYGTDDVPMDTFNKVWIVPQTASVYEHNQTVYIAETHLKVLLEEDYVATKMDEGKTAATQSDPDAKKYPPYMKEIIREVIIPEIEKEVNEGQNFALLRQIFHSLILAKWYKETIKNSLLSKVYVDQNKVIGIENDDADVKNKIYERYVEAFKKGVYSYIKEDYDVDTQTLVSRKYFSGGIVADPKVNTVYQLQSGSAQPVGDNYELNVSIEAEGAQGNQTAEALSENSDALSDSTKNIPLVFTAGLGGYHIDYEKINYLLSYASNHPLIVTAMGISAVGGLYYLWRRKMVSENLWRLSRNDLRGYSEVARSLKELGATEEQNVDDYIAVIDSIGYWGSMDTSYQLQEVIKKIVELGDPKAIDSLLKIKSGLESKSSIKYNHDSTINPAWERFTQAKVAVSLLQAQQSQDIDGYISILLSTQNLWGILFIIKLLGSLEDPRSIEALLGLLERSKKEYESEIAGKLKSLGVSEEEIRIALLKKQIKKDLDKEIYDQVISKIIKFWKEGYGYELFVKEKAVWRDNYIEEEITETRNFEEDELGDRWPDGNGRTPGPTRMWTEEVGTGEYHAVNHPILVAPAVYDVRKGSQLGGDNAMISSNASIGIIGALQEGAISIYNGQLMDISFVDQPIMSAMEEIEISIAAAITTAVVGSAYYWWRRYTVSGNASGLRSDNFMIRMKSDAWLRAHGVTNRQLVNFYIKALLSSHNKEVLYYATVALGQLGSLENEEIRARVRVSLIEMLNKSIYLTSDFQFMEGFYSAKFSLGDESAREERDRLRYLLGITSEDDSAMVSDVGGIDMNEIDVKRKGEGIEVNYDSKAFETLIDQPIDGFRPVIINMIPLPSLAPLLGFDLNEQKPVEVSSLPSKSQALESSIFDENYLLTTK